MALDQLAEMASIDLFAGTLWLYPVAGSVLVLCALRSLVRYHFEGRAQWYIHGTQIVVGIALCLVGLLAKDDHLSSEEQRLAAAKSPVVTLYYPFTVRGYSVLVVFCVYLLVTLFTCVSASGAASLTSRR